MLEAQSWRITNIDKFIEKGLEKTVVVNSTRSLEEEGNWYQAAGLWGQLCELPSILSAGQLGGN